VKKNVWAEIALKVWIWPRSKYLSPLQQIRKGGRIRHAGGKK
jgi:hypothetical protein